MIEVTAERRVYPRPTLPTSVTIPKGQNNSTASEKSTKSLSEKSKVAPSSSSLAESQPNTSPTKAKNSLMEEIAVSFLFSFSSLAVLHRLRLSLSEIVTL